VGEFRVQPARAEGSLARKWLSLRRRKSWQPADGLGKIQGARSPHRTSDGDRACCSVPIGRPVFLHLLRAARSAKF